MLTQGGVGDVIQDNKVVGVGPMDADTVPNPNASEVILTESYTVALRGDGHVGLARRLGRADPEAAGGPGADG